MKRKLQTHLLLLILFFGFSQITYSQTEKKTLVQGFWWDYKNDNYPGSWANYLTELAPRLKAMKVDAIWIPPSYKNNDPAWVGYSPFDHYDLGDKYQKGFVNTAVGTKDELLRMVAVMHANGIEVIQDVVLNHVDRAGSQTGAGGQDPEATYSVQTASGYKNFRYTCFATPAVDESECDYFAREGRWPKNYHNFHPHAGHNATSGDWEASHWGPDICYGYQNDGTGNGFGQSSNCSTSCSATCHDPTQGSGYMRENAREWLMWMKKQTGVDGWRFDAVKHFPHFVQEDVLYNTQHENGWANGGNGMFAVGEWVGGKADLDAYCGNVNNRAGTFDFGLRAFDGSGGLYGMIYGSGGYDIGGSTPGAQQNVRFIDISGRRIHRTVPFVNNHDTYRPQVDGSGNITGWNTGDELSAHIDPKEPRLGAAYAIIAAVDGNPQFFFEDLFNIHNQSNRWSHDPKNTSQLVAHSDLVNILQAHSALDFKGGDYRVRSAEASHWNIVTSSNNDDDHIVIERSGKAIIAATDAWNTDQESWVDSDFAPGTVLVDYSGGITTTSTVQADQRVNIKTRAVGYPAYSYSTSYGDHGAQYHGYSIWAPQGINITNRIAFNAPIPTTQEWEMANDLGDSHCSSLVQGGPLPAASTTYRLVGKIFPDGGSTVSYDLNPEIGGSNVILEFYSLGGTLLHSDSGSGRIEGSFTAPASTDWMSIKIHYDGFDGSFSCENTAASTPPVEQKVWVKVTYDAPEVVNVSAFPVATTVSFWTGAAGDADWTNPANWLECNNPTSNTDMVVIPECPSEMPTNIPTDFPVANIDNRSEHPLPVELLSFEGEVSRGNAFLTWTTASETNNKGFEVEKSLDGSTFRNIGFVVGKGTTTAVSNYEFTDETFSNAAYYRLKQVDLDGSFEYTNVVYLTERDKAITFTLYPNPTRENISLLSGGNFDLNQDLDIQILDIKGRTISTLKGKIDQINEALREQTNEFVAGMYLVRIIYNNESYALKFVKE